MSRTGSLLLLGLLGAGPAWAEDPTSDELPDAAAPPVAPRTTGAVEPVPSVVVAATLGAALPLRAFGPSVAPGLEAGVVADDAGRFTVLLGIGYSGGTATGTATDPAFPDGYTWSLTLRAMQIAPALRVRLLPWSERIAPEVSVGPVVTIGDAVATGTSGGAAFPETREARVSLGGVAAAGLVGRVGPGMLEGRLSLSVIHLDGDLTGPALVPSITPTIGYRVAR